MCRLLNQHPPTSSLVTCLRTYEMTPYCYCYDLIIGAIQVLRNAIGSGRCQLSRDKALRRCNTPFTLALLIRSETGFAPLRAFTLHQLIRINNLIRIKLNHLLEVVSHRFSLLRDLITSVDANRTRTKEEQIEINARVCICIYGVACQELSRSRSSARLSTKYHCKLSVAIL